MRILSPRFHGALDYVAAIVLIVAPFLLGLHHSNMLAMLLSLVLGVALLGYSMVTDYAYGITGALSFKIHLIFDTLAGIGAVAAPFIFGFAATAKWYYIVMGVGVLIVVALTDMRVSDETFGMEST